MDPVQVAFILQVLKLLCPELQRMAKESANPIDDIVVGILCSMAKVEIPPDILLKGGKQNG